MSKVLLQKPMYLEQNNTIPKNMIVMSNGSIMQKIMANLERIKDYNCIVLFTGESGTGKSLYAKVLHNMGIRKQEPFVHINCASLPTSLIESELFGYERGAFTGANITKPGKFEVAEHGTIFLDEIGTLSLEMQAKLLTVIEERKIERLGSNKSVPIKARIITATNINLEKAIEKNEFRLDLYYRLNVIRIEIPPMREHRDDIVPLVESFKAKFEKAFSKPNLYMKPEVWAALKKYDWPGNVRELENTIESIVALAESPISLNNLPPHIRNGIAVKTQYDYEKVVSDEERERLMILESLRDNFGNRQKTANDLGICRRTLQYKLKKYNII